MAWWVIFKNVINLMASIFENVLSTFFIKKKKNKSPEQTLALEQGPKARKHL